MYRNKPACLLIVFAIALNIINLFPILDSPYLGDDSWRESCLPGIIALTGLDMPRICVESVKDYIRDGRWYPLVVYYYAIFYYLTLYQYKLGVVVFVLANIILMGVLIRMLTGRQESLPVTLVLAPFFFQLRFYHDPLLSYYYLMQIGLMLIQLSVIFFIKSLRAVSSHYLTASGALYFCAVLIYEAFYPFCLIYVILAFLESRKNSIHDVVKSSLPFILIAVFNFGISLAVRIHFRTNYDGVTLNLDPFLVAVTFLKQISSAFPVSYFFLSGLSSQAMPWLTENISYSLIILILLWAMLWLSLCMNSKLSVKVLDGLRLKGAIFTGIALFLLPGLVVSLASKYQGELRWGLGYLPTYISAFGLLTLAVVIFLRVKQDVHLIGGFWKKMLLVTSTLVGVGMVGANFVGNSMVVQGYNIAEHYQRSLMEKASANGLFLSVPEGSLLALGAPVRSWDNAAFYKMHSGLTLQVVKLPGFGMDWQQGVLSYDQAFRDYSVDGADSRRYDFEKGKVPPEIFVGYSGKFKGQQGVVVDRKMKLNVDRLLPQIFFAKYAAVSKNIGYAALGHLVSVQVSDDRVVSAKCDAIRLYVKFDPNMTRYQVNISGMAFDRKNPSQPEQFFLDKREITDLGGGDSFRLLELTPGSSGKLIDANSLSVVIEGPETP